MFFTQGLADAVTTERRSQPKSTQQDNDHTSQARTADREFQRFVARHGSFRSYLRFPI
ncbi:hypothetical protein [Salinisphaera sp. T31B1]|uniref:hypothetical protein n=1 Tax=Salinisphaera sp. T31B1 TaxID=727963 RepID=UPI003340D98D